MTNTIDIMDVPWIPFASLSFLDALVRPALRVFEWGSGGSTIYFARKYCRLVSIEHDLVWYETVQTELEQRGYTWVELEYIPAGETCIGTDKADPTHYYEPPCSGNYRQYASVIDRYEDGFFDLIMVDGTARPSCLQHAYPKLKSNGYLILDNSEREYYLHVVGNLFKSWERCTFWGHGPINPYQWECTIWQRP